jgi:hypothetical protein
VDNHTVADIVGRGWCLMFFVDVPVRRRGSHLHRQLEDLFRCLQPGAVGPLHLDLWYPAPWPRWTAPRAFDGCGDPGQRAGRGQSVGY